MFNPFYYYIFSEILRLDFFDILRASNVSQANKCIIFHHHSIDDGNLFLRIQSCVLVFFGSLHIYVWVGLFLTHMWAPFFGYSNTNLYYSPLHIRIHIFRKSREISNVPSYGLFALNIHSYTFDTFSYPTL